MNPDQLRRFRFMSDQFRSGDVRRVDLAVTDLLSNPDPVVLTAFLTGTYVDVHGMLWVPPAFVVMKSRQPAADYGFWQLLSLAPEDVCLSSGINRNEIEIVRFRSHSEILTHPDSYPAFYQGDEIFRMKRFPAGICSLPALRHIDARDTSFSALPVELGNCALLKEFSIAFFTGDELPAAMGSIKTLETIQVFHSRIEKWPVFIADLPMLRFLKIAACKFGSLPNNILLPDSLKALHLDNMELMTIPESLFRCAGLQELSLVGNSIADIPDKFHLLPELKRINFKENPAATKPDRLKPIEHLVIRGTRKSYFHRPPGAETFKSSFLDEDLAHLLDSPGEDTFADLFDRPTGKSPSVYRDPGPPPEEIAPAVQLITSMLSSADKGVFTAGMKLLESSGADADFTEYCLAAIPPVRKGKQESWRQQNMPNQLVLDFLINYPNRSYCREGSWRYAFTQIHFQFSPERFNRIGELFPNLTAMQVNFSDWLEPVSGSPLQAHAETITLEAYKGTEMEWSGSSVSLRNLTLKDSLISGKLHINGLPNVKKIRILSTNVSAIVISNCPELEEVEHDWNKRSDFRVAKVTVTDCPALKTISLKKICLSGLVLSDLPSLRSLIINGPGTNTSSYRITGCPVLDKLHWSGGRLSGFPAPLAQLSSLTELALVKCGLTTLQADLSVLTKLRSLNLTGNLFSEVPASILKLQALERCNLGYQKKNQPTKSLIQNLPEWLNEIKSLRLLCVLMPELKLRKLAAGFQRLRLTITNNVH